MKVKLNTYKLDMRKESDVVKYKEIQEICKKLGYKLFDCIDLDKGSFHHYPSEQTIDPKHLFSNQYNTIEGKRVFDWYESININNKSLKNGYYLTGDVEELRQAKLQRYACGYCGKQHDGHDAPLTCSKCLGSKYLTEKELPLLVMQPILGEKRNTKGPNKQDYDAAQALARVKMEQARTERRKLKIEELKQGAIKKKNDIDYETALRCEVLAADLDDDNLIYYNHTKEWVFGWNKGVTKEFSEKIRNADLSFDVKIIHQDGTEA